MSEKTTLRKSHLARLQRMLADFDTREAYLQQTFGDRTAGSMRSSDWRDAEALRAALQLLGASAIRREAEGK